MELHLWKCDFSSSVAPVSSGPYMSCCGLFCSVFYACHSASTTGSSLHSCSLMEMGCFNSGPSSAGRCLGDVELITSLLWASVSSFVVKWVYWVFLLAFVWGGGLILNCMCHFLSLENLTRFFLQNSLPSTCPWNELRPVILPGSVQVSLPIVLTASAALADFFSDDLRSQKLKNVGEMRVGVESRPTGVRS